MSHTQYIDLYRQHRADLEQASTPCLNARREEAARLLSAQGLPGTRCERYKYTDAAEAFAPDFALDIKGLSARVNPYDTYKCAVPNLSTALFFVLNDTPCTAPPASRVALPEGCVVCSLREAAEQYPHLLEQYYGRAAGHDSGFSTGHDGVTLLNTLLARDGMMVYVPRGVKVTTPIQIVSVADAAVDCMGVRRLLVIADDEAEVTLLCCEHAAGKARFAATQVTEAYAGRGASIHLYGIEETGERYTRFHNLYTEQQADSHVTATTVTLTCGTSRCRIDARLLGPGANASLQGAVIADAQQHVDCNALVEHMAPDCQSNMLYKYVLAGHSLGAFAGKVYVAPGAQRTAAQQTHANLCADATARALSQPMLEIYADDVKCNHGSTIGKMDEAALLYMRQRGIPEAEARLLLQHAFVNEVLERVHIPHLRERLQHLVEMRFRGELSSCRGCRLCK